MAAQPSSSPEECCICADEFTNIYELAAHLIRHAEESSFQKTLEDSGTVYEEPISSAPKPSKTKTKTVYPEFITTTFCQIENLNRSISKRPDSPIVLEIDSDSDDEISIESSPVPPVKMTPTNVFPSSKRGRPSSGGGVKKNNSSSQRAVPQRPSHPDAQPPYTCRVCKKTFDDPKLFRDHLMTHEKLRPFPCHICKKTFAYRGTLRQHLRMHVGEKFHQCPKCSKRFTIKDVLRRHCESAHNLVVN